MRVTIPRRGIPYLCDETRFKKGHAMTWSSDATWVVIYAIVLTFCIYSWAVVPA